MSMRMWSIITLIMVFMFQSIIRCHIKAITQRVGVGEYACIIHPCTMPGDTTQYVQEFHDVYIWGEGKIIASDGTWFVLGHVPWWERLPITFPDNIILREE